MCLKAEFSAKNMSSMWWVGVGPKKKGTFDFFQNLIITPSGDLK